MAAATVDSEAPSTLTPQVAPDNPLDVALKKLMTTKTAKEAQDEFGGLVGYTPYSGAPAQPAGDTVTINAQPGTGATQAEQWTHESQLGSALQTSLEFEAKQRQQAEENARAEAQLAMSQATAKQQAAISVPQYQAAQLANQQTQRAMALAQAANQRAELDAYIKSGGYTLSQLQNMRSGIEQQSAYAGSNPVNAPGMMAQYMRYQQSGQNPVYANYIPQKSTQQIDPATGQLRNHGLAYGETYKGPAGTNY
jgi:hypothetical protein